MSEFRWIAEYFAPLASSPAALGLADDAALIGLPPGEQLIASCDALVAGVHFTGDEPPVLIARKALRVNLSDLAAMGAQPYGYLLSCILPRHTDAAWVADFAAGLRYDQELFGITLLGGDTTATSGPLCISITVLGMTPQGSALRRSGAQAGDDLYVSGTIGDAVLGLRILQGTQAVAETLRDDVIGRYHLPQPRLKLGKALRGVATAAMDISDGLVQDLGHLCAASGCAAVIHAADLPKSPAARTLLEQDPALLEVLLTGGDDYELLFTAPPQRRAEIATLAQRLELPITRIGMIGAMQAAARVTVLDAQGVPLFLKRPGFDHFS